MALFNSNYQTDNDWKKWGKIDPYFGVFTDDKFKRSNLNDASLTEFFASGQDHIDHIVKKIQTHIDPQFKPGTVVDFGCGTGRLLLPLSQIAERAIGIDISEDMLAEVSKNAKERGISNIETFLSDDELSCLSSMNYDLIHTYIVLQHIPVIRGEQIIQALINKLSKNGVGVLHMTFENTLEQGGGRLSTRIKKAFPFLGRLKSMLSGGSGNEPVMQMNSYSLSKIFGMLYKAGILNSYVELTNHGGSLGAVVYFKKG